MDGVCNRENEVIKYLYTDPLSVRPRTSRARSHWNESLIFGTGCEGLMVIDDDAAMCEVDGGRPLNWISSRSLSVVGKGHP